jgi:hypothetical protein
MSSHVFHGMTLVPLTLVPSTLFMEIVTCTSVAPDRVFIALNWLEVQADWNVCGCGRLVERPPVPPRYGTAAGSCSQNPARSRRCTAVAPGSEHTRPACCLVCLCGSVGRSSPAATDTDPVSSADSLCCSRDGLSTSPSPSAAAGPAQSAPTSPPADHAPSRCRRYLSSCRSSAGIFVCHRLQPVVNRLHNTLFQPGFSRLPLLEYRK